MVQSTSPLFARQSYWCIVGTLKQAGLKTLSVSCVRAVVRRMGIRDRRLRRHMSRRCNCPPACASSPPRNVAELFIFPNDMQPVPAEPNRLNDQVLVRYYEREWKDDRALVTGLASRILRAPRVDRPVA